jgi:hypothetical protein
MPDDRLATIYSDGHKTRMLSNDFTRPKLAFYDMGQLVNDIYVVWGVRESKYAPVNYSSQLQWNKFTRNRGPFLAEANGMVAPGKEFTSVAFGREAEIILGFGNGSYRTFAAIQSS